MTGTERAALRLALGVLRRTGSEMAALQVLYAIAETIGLAIAVQRSPGPSRLLRARLALYIRAVLRAERGEAVDNDGSAMRSERTRHWFKAALVVDYWPDDARPLWLDAPEHRS